MPKGKTNPASTAQKEKSYQPLEYDVNIYPSRGDGAQKATATVNINGQFAIRGLKIMEGTKGIFVSMPSYKAGNEYKDICFPCTKESRADFDRVVLAAYEQKMVQSQNTALSQTTAPQDNNLAAQEQGQQMAGM